MSEFGKPPLENAPHFTGCVVPASAEKQRMSSSETILSLLARTPGHFSPKQEAHHCPNSALSPVLCSSKG